MTTAAVDYKKGDEVEYQARGTWKRGTVTDIYNTGYFRAVIQPEGFTPSGRRRGLTRCRLERVRLVRSYDPTVANIYADWLDEHDEPTAAQKLRRAFPLSPEQEDHPESHGDDYRHEEIA